jgi:hypothetical protein
MCDSSFYRSGLYFELPLLPFDDEVPVTPEEVPLVPEVAAPLVDPAGAFSPCRCVVGSDCFCPDDKELLSVRLAGESAPVPVLCAYAAPVIVMIDASIANIFISLSLKMEACVRSTELYVRRSQMRAPVTRRFSAQFRTNMPK